MMRKKLAPLAAAVAVTVGVSGCAGSVSNETGDEGPIEFSYADLTGETNPLGIAAQAMFEAIDEAYEGEIEVEYFWSGAMAGGEEVLDAVGSGTVDVASVPTAYYPQDLPAASWAEGLTNLNPTGPTVHPYVSNVGMIQAFRSDSIMEEYSKHGIEPLATATAESYALICKDKISSLDDAKGKLVRVASTQHVKEIEALGMSPISLAHGETYEALQRGTIDCTVSSPTGGDDLGLYEMAGSILPIGFSPAVLPVLITETKMDSLPEDLQEIIRTTGVEAYYSAIAGSYSEETADLVEDGNVSPDSSVEILLPDDLVDAVAEQRAKAAETLAADAPEAMQDAEAVVEDFTQVSEEMLVEYEEASGVEAKEVPADGEAYRDAFRTFMENQSALDDFIDSVSQTLSS